MERSIVGFHLDPQGEWVADLACGHRQHLYHRPPFQVRPWVLEDTGRAERLGTPLDCPLCDRCEPPDTLHFTRRTRGWDAHAMPSGLSRGHKLGSGTWGNLVVLEGRLRFTAWTSPPIDRVIERGAVQALPPGVEHEVHPDEDARFFLEFFEVVVPPRQPSSGEEDPHDQRGH